MRPIKFRGKLRLNDNWLYGDLVHIAGHQHITYIESEDGSSNRVLPEFIGQFVGFTDSRRREIYEKDVLESSDKLCKGPVLWDENLARFVWYDFINKRTLPLSQIVCEDVLVCGYDIFSNNVYYND